MSQRDVCLLIKADAWKPAAYPGKRWEFVIFNCGLGYFLMRLFEDAKGRDFWVRRNRRWNSGVQIQSLGAITWKGCTATSCMSEGEA